MYVQCLFTFIIFFFHSNIFKNVDETGQLSERFSYELENGVRAAVWCARNQKNQKQYKT